jgi:hypothetical protein
VSWEWVSPSATAVVGIVGISGTVYSVSREQQASAEMAKTERIARRNEVRGEFELANLEAVRTALSDFARTAILYYMAHRQVALERQSHYGKRAAPGEDELDESARLTGRRVVELSTVILDDAFRRCCVERGRMGAERLDRWPPRLLGCRHRQLAIGFLVR